MAAYTSSRSLRALEKLHPKVRRVLLAVIEEQDNCLLSTFRSNDEQGILYSKGRTTPGDIVTNAGPGESIHNVWFVDDEGEGAVAFDLAPYPIAWDDKERFALLAGRILQEGVRQGVRLRWGNDWDQDGIPVASDSDEQFPDPGHFEAVLDKP